MFRGDNNVGGRLIDAFAIAAAILAVLDLLSGVAAGINPEELVFAAEQPDFWLTINDFRTLPVGVAFEPFTTGATNSTATIIATFNASTGGDALSFRASAVLAEPTFLALTTSITTPIAATVLTVALRCTGTGPCITNQSLYASTTWGPAAVVPTLLVRTVGDALSFGTNAAVAVPALQTLTTGTATSIGATINPVAARNADAVAAVTKFARLALATGATATVRTAGLIDAAGFANDRFAKTIEALLAIFTLSADSPAAIGSTTLAVAVRNALTFNASARFAKEVIRAFTAQSVASVFSTNFAIASGHANATSPLALLTILASATSTAATISPTLLPVTGRRANAHTVDAYGATVASAATATTPVGATIFACTRGLAAPAVGALRPRGTTLATTLLRDTGAITAIATLIGSATAARAATAIPSTFLSFAGRFASGPQTLRGGRVADSRLVAGGVNPLQTIVVVPLVANPAVCQFTAAARLTGRAFVSAALARLPAAASIVVVLRKPHAACLAILCQQLAILAELELFALTDAFVADPTASIIFQGKNFHRQVVEPAGAVGAFVHVAGSVFEGPEAHLASRRTIIISKAEERFASPKKPIAIGIKVDGEIIAIDLDSYRVRNTLRISNRRFPKLCGLATLDPVDPRPSESAGAAVANIWGRTLAEEEKVEVGGVMVAEDEADGVIVGILKSCGENVVFPEVRAKLNVVVQRVGALAPRPD